MRHRSRRHKPGPYLHNQRNPAPRNFGRGHLKVDNLLRDEDRDAYYALLRQPTTTHEMAYQWLKARGYNVGRSAVKHHKRRFDHQLKDIRRSAELSLACADLVRQVGVNRMSDAAVVRFEALLTEALFRKFDSGIELDLKEWQTFGRALTHAVANRTKVERTRLADAEAKRETERDGKARKPRRFDGVAVANAVRRRFGVPLPPDAPPALPAPTGATGGSPQVPALPPPPVESPPRIPPLPPGEGRGEGA